MLFTSILVAGAVCFTQAPDTLQVAVVTSTVTGASHGSAPARRETAEELRRRGTASLTEALRTFAGVSIRDYGGIGGIKTVSIRSFGSQHTGISYDGLAITNSRNGQVDIGRFNLDNLQSVKVEIGGSDDIFRNARLAGSVGTVVLRSARPVLDSASTRFSAQLRAASFGTLNPHLGLQQRLSKRWTLDLWADWMKSDGDYPFTISNGSATETLLRTNSDISSVQGEMNVFGDIGAGGDLQFKLSYGSSERGLPGSVVLYTQNPTERLWQDALSAGVVHNVNLRGGFSIKSSLSYSLNADRYLNEDPKYPAPEDDRYLLQDASLTGVALWQSGGAVSLSLAEDFLVSTLREGIPQAQFPTRETSYTALSARYEGKSLTAVASLLGLLCFEQVKIGKPAPFRSRLSPSVSLSWKVPIAADWRIRTSFKDSYRLPTFDDLYFLRTGNRDLQPESAYQFNLGTVWSTGRGTWYASVSADGYFNTVKNRIVAIPTMFVWRMRNVGKVEMAGCDVSAELRGKVAGWLEVSSLAGWSYQYAVDVTDPEAKNYRHQIPYTPRHSGSGSVTFSTPWVNLSYTVTAVGLRYSLAQNLPAYAIAPYADHSASINRQFSIGRKHPVGGGISCEVLNITDANYEIIQYYPMPGRQFRLTLKVTF